MSKNPALAPVIRVNSARYATFSACELKEASVVLNFRITAKNDKQGSEVKSGELPL